ncbi:hypothetical protein [Nostoc sp.]
MIEIADQLDRRVFAGDPSFERCRQAMPFAERLVEKAGYAYAHSRLTTEPLGYP